MSESKKQKQGTVKKSNEWLIGFKGKSIWFSLFYA